MKDRYEFRRVNQVTGLFVLAVVGLVVAGVIFSGHSQRWFARKYTVQVLLPESGAFGLRRGDEVFIAGVSVGWVDDIRVDRERRMKAEVKIRGDFEGFVRVDSTATVKKVFGVAGDSFMEITRGEGKPLPVEQAEIVCLSAEELPAKMERMLEELRGELRPVVQKAGETLEAWAVLGNNLQETQQSLHRLVGRLDDLALGMEQGKGTAGKLLSETVLADEAHALLEGTAGAVTELRGVLTNLNGTVTHVRVGTARMPEITEAVANEAKALPGLVAQAQKSMREIERLAEAMQRHWLFRRYVDKTKPSGDGDGDEDLPSKKERENRSGTRKLREQGQR